MMTWYLCHRHKGIFEREHLVSITPHRVVEVLPDQCEDCRTEKVRLEYGKEYASLRGRGI